MEDLASLGGSIGCAPFGALYARHAVKQKVCGGACDAGLCPRREEVIAELKGDAVVEVGGP